MLDTSVCDDTLVTLLLNHPNAERYNSIRMINYLLSGQLDVVLTKAKVYQHDKLSRWMFDIKRRLKTKKIHFAFKADAILKQIK